MLPAGLVFIKGSENSGQPEWAAEIPATLDHGQNTVIALKVEGHTQ